MAQVPKPKLLDEGPEKTVGFRAPINLWSQFKAEVYRDGLTIEAVLVAMIRLFLADSELRQKIIEKASELEG